MSESIIGEYIPCRRCGDLFEKRGWNSQYCPACQGPHHAELAMRNYYAKQGKRIRAGHNWSDYHRFKFYLDKTWQSAICPVCGAHMSNDPCSSEQGLRQCQPQEIETWKPWK